MPLYLLASLGIVSRHAVYDAQGNSGSPVTVFLVLEQ